MCCISKVPSVSKVDREFDRKVLQVGLLRQLVEVVLQGIREPLVHVHQRDDRQAGASVELLGKLRVIVLELLDLRVRQTLGEDVIHVGATLDVLPKLGNRVLVPSHVHVKTREVLVLFRHRVQLSHYQTCR